MLRNAKSIFKSAIKQWLAVVLAMLIGFITPYSTVLNALAEDKTGETTKTEDIKDTENEPSAEEGYNDLAYEVDDDYYTPNIDDFSNQKRSVGDGEELDIEKFEFSVENPDKSGEEEQSESQPQSGSEQNADYIYEEYFDEEENPNPIVSTDDGLRLQLNLDGETYTLVSYAANAATVYVPLYYVDGKKITRIDDSAFAGKNGLKKLILHDEIEFIGESVFDNCPNLEFNEKEGGLYLGTDTNAYFYYYKPTDLTLAEYTVSEGVIIIGANAFVGCKNLRKITFPKTVKEMGYRAAGDSRIIEDITLPFFGENGNDKNWHLGWVFGARTIGGNVSYVPLTLKSLTVLGGEKIHKNTLYGVDTLESLTVPFLGAYLNDKTNGFLSYFWGGNSYNDNIVPQSLKKVEILSGMTAIIDYAFYNLTRIEEVILPNSVISLGEYVFSGCSKLNDIVIPDSVTTIESSAFIDCNNLQCNEYSNAYYLDSVNNPYLILIRAKDTNIIFCEISENVRVIHNYAFRNCSNLTSIEIPNSVTSIGSDAFDGCISLTRIDIGDNVTSIGSNAFYNCSSLTSIEIPDSVTSIGWQAFAGCSSLTSVTIGNGVTSIKSYAFYNCSGLTSVYYTGDIADWCNIRFGGYDSNPLCYAHNLYIDNELVTELVLPNTVTIIKNYAFYNCSSLTSIEIPDSVTSIGMGAFDNCSSLTSVTIPDSVTSIGDSAFYGCSSLTSIVLPDSVTSIGDSAFAYCNAIKSVICPSIALPHIKNTNLENVIITSGESIGSCALEYCSSLKSVVIPYSVTSIESSAFRDCSSLASIEIPNSVTSIGSYAFYYCNSLTSIVLPDSVTSIGSSAFYGCSSLMSIEISDSITSIGINAFAYCSALKSVICPSIAITYINSKNLKNVIITSGENICSRAFSGCSSLVSVIIPDSIISIEEQAFSWCISLKNIEIPDSVTSIGSEAFCGCDSLTYIKIPFVGGRLDGTSNTSFDYIFGTIPTSLKTVVITGGSSIASNAFQYCSTLINIEIPDSVTSIGNNAFSSCSSLTSVTIGNGVTSIGDYAFYYCSRLTSIVLPDSVTSIGNNAFSSCSSLTSIVLPDSVTSIGVVAFYGCSSLYYVTNKSDLELTFGSTDNGYLAYYAKAIEDKNGNVAYKDNPIYLENDFMFEYVSGEYRLIAYLGNEETVTLPLNYNGNTYSIYYMRGVRNVIIPQGMTSIGSDAFRDCSSLASIEIPNSVTSIGSYAFYYCNSLASIEIPNSVTSIGSSAFNDCYSLPYNEYDNAYYLGNGNNPYYALIKAKDTSISSCNINSNTKIIAETAFWGCRGLISIEIQGSVKYIGERAFQDCSGLISAMIGNSVTSIGSYAFYRCSNLTNLTIGSGGIGNYAFQNCSSLTSITIGNSVTSIGYEAFYGCSSLTSVTIGNSVTSIGSYAFNNCSSLTSITIGNSVTSIGYEAFYGCSSLYYVKNKSNLQLTIGSSANGYVACYAKAIEDKNGNVVYKNNSIYIEDDFMFEYIRDKYVLKAYLGSEEIVTLPLTFNGNFYSISGMRGVRNVIIPQGITNIRNSAFYECSSLKSIEIPNSVVSIEDWAFWECNNLKSVTYIGTKEEWENKVTVGSGNDCLLSIIVFSGGEKSRKANMNHDSNGDDKSENDTNENISKQEKQTNKDYVKKDEQSEEDIIIRPYSQSAASQGLRYAMLSNETCKITGIGTCTDTELIIPNIIGVCVVVGIDNSAFQNCNRLRSVIIPDSVTSIGTQAFYGCSSLMSIVIPNSVTSIRDQTFYNCGALTSIVIPDSVTSIGTRAFYRCYSLTSIKIPNSVKSIGDQVFYDCKNLANVIIPDSVISIGSNAFRGSGLTRIVVSEGVTNLGSSAFSGCNSLTSVTLPNSLLKINSKAFAGCTNLEQIIYNGEKTEWRHVLRASDWDDGTENYSLVFAKEDSGLLFESNDEITEFYVSGYVGKGRNVDLNEKFSGRFVTEVTNNAFNGNKTIRTLLLPDSITKIGRYAFNDCTYLTTLRLPMGVEDLGFGFLSGCNSLTSIELPFLGKRENDYKSNYVGYLFGSKTRAGNGDVVPKNLKTITIYNGEFLSVGAFYNSYYLKTINLPDNIKTIGDYAFFGARSLTDIDLKEGITDIGSYALASCNDLTELILPNTLNHLGECALSGSNRVEAINIGTLTLDVFEDYIYKNPLFGLDKSSSSLLYYTVSEDNTQLAVDEYGILYVKIPAVINGANTDILVAVVDCPASANIYNYFMPSHIVEIMPYAFAYNNTIKSIDLEYVRQIGNNAFFSCTGLETVNFTDPTKQPPEELAEYIGKKTYSQRIGDRAFMGCINLLKADMQIDGIKSIGEQAFTDCNKLKTVILGSSVESIGLNAFSTSAAGGGALERIVVSRENPYYMSIEGVLFAKNDDGTLTLVLYPACKVKYKTQMEYTIENRHVYKFNIFGFKFELGMPYITRITYTIGEDEGYEDSYSIPEFADNGTRVQVSKIESYAFKNAKHLKNLTIDPSCEMKVGDYAFSDSYLEHITVGENVTSLGLLRGEGEYTVFSGTDYLITIDVDEKNEFYRSIGGVLFDKDVTKIIKYPSQKVGREYYIPKTVDTVASMAFKDNKNIGLVSVNSNLLAVGLEAFYGCSNIQMIYFNHVYAPKSIMENAFTVDLSVNSKKNQAVIGYNEDYYENGDESGEYGWKNYDGVYNLKPMNVVPAYDPDFKSSIYYAVAVVDSSGCAIDNAWVSLTDFRGNTETVQATGGIATFWSYAGADGTDFALDFEEMYTLSVMDEQGTYYPYLSKNIYLDGKTLITYITLSLIPEVYGVSCNGREINSESVTLNKSQFDYEIDTSSMTAAQLDALGITRTRGGAVTIHETVPVSVVAYFDKALVDSITAESCILYQGEDVVACETVEVETSSDGTAIFYYEVSAYLLSQDVPISAEFSIMIGGEEQSVQAHLNIGVIDFDFTENDIDFHFSDMNVDLSSAGETLMKLLNGRSWNFNLGKNVEFGIEIEDDEVSIGLSAKYNKSSRYNSATQLSAMAGFEEYKQAHNKGSYFYQFHRPVVEMRNSTPILHKLTYNVRFYECPDTKNYFYYRCRIYEGTYDNKLYDFYGRVNGITSFFGVSLKGRKRVAAQATEIYLGHMLLLTKNLVETNTNSYEQFKSFVANDPKIDYPYVAKNDPYVEVSNSFSIGLEGRINLRFDKEKFIVLSSGYVKGTLSYAFDCGAQFVVWFIPITLNVHIGLDGKLQIDLKVDNEGHLNTKQISLELSANVTVELGIGCALVSAGVYGSIGCVFILDFYPEFGVRRLNFSGEIGVYAKILFWRKSLALWSGYYTPIDKPAPYISDDDGEGSGGGGYGARGAKGVKSLASLYLADEYEQITPSDVSQDARLFVSDGKIYKVYFENVYDKEGYDENDFVKLCVAEWLGEDWSEGRMIDDNGLSDGSYMLYQDGDSSYVVYAQRKTKGTSNEAEDIYSDMGNYVLKTAKIIGTTVSDVSVIPDCTEKYKYFEQITVRNGTLTAVWAENADNNMFGVSPENYIDSNGVSHTFETTANSIWISTYENGEWTTPKCIKDGLSTITNLVINNAGDIYYIVDSNGDLVDTEDRVLYVKRASSLKHIAINDIAEGSVTNVFTYGDKVVYRFNAVVTEEEEDTSGLYSIRNSEADELVLGEEQTSGMSDNFKAVLNNDEEIVSYIYYQNTTWIEDNTECNGTAIYGYFFDGKWGTPVRLTEPVNGEYISSFDVYLDENANALFITVDYNDGKDSVWNETFELPLNEKVVLCDYSIDYREQTLSLTLKNNGTTSSEVSVSIDGNSAVLLTAALNSGKEETFKVAIGENKTPQKVEIFAGSRAVDIIEGLDFSYSDLNLSLKQIVIGGKNILLVAVKNNGNISASGTVYLKYETDTPKKSNGFDPKVLPIIRAGSVYYFEVSLENAEDYSLSAEVVVDGDTEKGDAEENNVVYLSVNTATSATGGEIEVVPFAVSDYYEISAIDNKDLAIEFIKNGYELVGVTLGGQKLSLENYSEDNGLVLIFKEYILSLPADYYSVVAEFAAGEKSYSVECFVKILEVFDITWTYFDGENDVSVTTRVKENTIPVSPETGDYETQYYNYVFSGWDKDEDGVADKLSVAKGKCSYTAVYRAEGKKFNVVWTVGEKTFNETYSYGQTPDFKGSVSMEGYDFNGWDKEVVAVTENAEYTAVYTKQVVTIKGDLNGDGIVNTRDLGLLKQYVIGATTLTDKQIEAANVYEDYDSAGNAIINTRDVARLQQYIVGIIESF